VVAILAGMLSSQLGASLAKGLFPALGAVGATALRLVMAAVVLSIFYRPWRGHLIRHARESGHAWDLAGYGFSLAFMNLAFYLALARAPMGVVVAVEFIGPLAVALASSRRSADFLWVVTAVCGLVLLVPWRAGLASADALGLGLALLSGVGWAGYIVFGTRAGAAHGGNGVAMGMVLGALLILPVGGPGLVAASPGWTLLATGLAVALLSSAIPYVLEIHAMQALPTRTFGIFMSVEPAVAALVGLFVLGEHLSLWQGLGIAGVVAASLGSAATSRQSAA
jgi:inner membrane transporter RhtA